MQTNLPEPEQQQGLAPVPRAEQGLAQETPAPGFLRGLYSNLRAGLRIVLLRRVEPSAFVTTFGQVLALLVIAAGVAALSDWLSADAEAQLDFGGIYSWAVCIVVGLWACALAARASRGHAETRAFIVSVLSVAPYLFLILAAFAMTPLPAGSFVFAIVAGVLVLVFGIRALSAVRGSLRVSSLLIAALAAGITAAGTYYGYIYPRFWQTPYDQSAESDDPDTVAAESTLFDQPARIEEAMENVEAGVPGVTDVFFVGLAGDGSQQIFKREALFGEQVFASRMGSGKHSLALINDESDRISHPLGTMTGLRYALKLVASRMNPDEDILVLFLTSHGSQESGLYVHNGNLPLNDIEPEDLRRALDAAGIKWRVVIVSACYSGAFVEPLENDDTLVMTAADADNTSFGCADDRDLTYFGEAFLRDAMPKATSLEGAFEIARDDIARREKAESLTPSNPQIFVGGGMRKKLGSVTLQFSPPPTPTKPP